MENKILIIENKMMPPLGSEDFRRYLSPHRVEVRRAPEGDLPQDPTQYSHIILTGSKCSCLSQEAWVENLISFIKKTVTANVPLLGICFGHQIIARAFGNLNSIGKASAPEFGWVNIKKNPSESKNPLLNALEKSFFSFQSHFEEVFSLTSDFIIDAQSQNCKIQAFHHKEKPVFGIQFHPEKNIKEGEESLKQKKGSVPQKFMFNVGKGHKCFSDKIPEVIFQEFLKTQRLQSSAKSSAI